MNARTTRLSVLAGLLLSLLAGVLPATAAPTALRAYGIADVALGSACPAAPEGCH